MELIGRINRRKIYYLQIRNNRAWKYALPKKDWLAFTVVNAEDEELVPPAVTVCLDNDVAYICSTGTLAGMTEEYFDEEIVTRALDYEIESKKKFDYDLAPVTTSDQNFSEGFWFATSLASDLDKEIDKVVCLDFTKRKVRNHLIDLIGKINNGWLPSDEKIELAQYDS